LIGSSLCTVLFYVVFVSTRFQSNQKQLVAEIAASKEAENKSYGLKKLEFGKTMSGKDFFFYLNPDSLAFPVRYFGFLWFYEVIPKSSTEVTQKQFLDVMGYNPSLRQNCLDCPVENINREEVLAFLDKLNENSGCSLDRQEIWDVYRKKSDRNASGCYRLPTREEWRMVCQAGTQNYRGGLDSEKDRVNSIWFQRNSFATVREVTTLRANPWGFYDMLGNAEEWVIDDFPSESLTGEVLEDPLNLAQTMENKHGRMRTEGACERKPELDAL